MPTFAGGSYFGRLLDWKQGGYCSISPVGRSGRATRRYHEGTLVLETSFRIGDGEIRLTDFFAMRRGGKRSPYAQIIRIVEGVHGNVKVRVHVEPRFDYGEIGAWIRREDAGVYGAIGGNDAMRIAADFELTPLGHHACEAVLSVEAGARHRLSLRYIPPELLDENPPGPPDPEELDRRLDETIEWWQRWASRGRMEGPDEEPVLRSAVVLKALANAPTGAMVAAPTTSLPEVPGGDSNWDYRFSWIRDSSFAVRSLAELGHDAEADGFRRFIERSAAGSAEDLQIVYGVGGERRLNEEVLDHLEGYDGARPVRIGNAAHSQVQLDVYGELLDLAWRWHERGHSPDDDHWRFLVELVDTAAANWREPDRGLWEIRGRRLHFVHSKAMCWTALEYGIRLAKECSRQAPIRRWTKVRNEIRATVERDGFDRKRNTFVQAFGRRALDAALLLLPETGFVAYDDDRMVGTVDAVRRELEDEGFVYRYRPRPEMGNEREGAFLPCSFWLAECLARQGRLVEGREVFDRASAAANDLGLFSDEYDVSGGRMLGNFPQGLTHLSHIAAAVALREQAAAD
jgi:GH15 family glucan-1,4-alpha-glucosidase